jgi:hypothetical protein
MFSTTRKERPKAGFIQQEKMPIFQQVSKSMGDHPAASYLIDIILFGGRLCVNMRRLLIFLLLSILAAACNGAASSTHPSEPALNFPTLAPDSLPLCRTPDLDFSSNSNQTTDGLVMGITLTNNTKQICTLSNPPQIKLLDENKNPIDLHALDASPAQTPPVPALMQLAPGENAILTLIWQNYCQKAPLESAYLRLALSNGQILDVDIKIGAAPDCTAANKPSTILVVPYSAPP